MTDRKNTPNIVLEDCRILFRNFAGGPTKFNPAGGKRTFNVILPPEIVDDVIKDGWNVKWLAARDEDEADAARLEVTVNFSGPRPPNIVMITSRGRTKIPEEMLEILDWAIIKQCDVIIRPYHWDVNGNQGVKAYAQSVFITIEEDELEMKYADVPEAHSLTAGGAPLQIETYDPNIIDGEVVE